jgi:DNA-directed RNA polymerase subunit RPC12/RpoP
MQGEVEMKRVCAWCKKKFEDVGEEEGVTHTICGLCRTASMEKEGLMLTRNCPMCNRRELAQMDEGWMCRYCESRITDDDRLEFFVAVGINRHQTEVLSMKDRLPVPLRDGPGGPIVGQIVSMEDKGTSHVLKCHVSADDSGKKVVQSLYNSDGESLFSMAAYTSFLH